jgi:hypothetical protein
MKELQELTLVLNDKVPESRVERRQRVDFVDADDVDNDIMMVVACHALKHLGWQSLLPKLDFRELHSDQFP